jgi:hypothetical protein
MYMWHLTPVLVMLAIESHTERSDPVMNALADGTGLLPPCMLAAQTTGAIRRARSMRSGLAAIGSTEAHAGMSPCLRTWATMSWPCRVQVPCNACNLTGPSRSYGQLIDKMFGGLPRACPGGPCLLSLAAVPAAHQLLTAPGCMYTASRRRGGVLV